MTDKINDINQKFKGKKLLAFDETTGQFAMVSPHILTSTVYTEEGVPLDDYLGFKPQDLINKVDDILKDAPKDYDTFKEVAAELNNNKDSIVEILRAISTRVKRPEGGREGQVLKLDDKGQFIFADDNDTIYNHPETHPASMITTDNTRRFVTDSDKENWDGKLDQSAIIDSDSKASKDTVFNSEYMKLLLDNIGKELNKKAYKVQGKGLSTNDYDNKAKEKVDAIPKNPKYTDTTYDLTSYAKSKDIEETYAKITTLMELKTAIERELAKYELSENVETSFNLLKSELDKKESTIHKGGVNGYAALDDNGKVPEEQLPEKAIREYDLTPYAKSEDIKKTYATKQEVSAGKLDYTAENIANKGKANGYASLGDDGKVPADQLPSYVDDVLEFESKSKFPSAGEKGKIYVDLSTENIYRWSGSMYTEISPSLITQAEIKKLQGIEDGAEKNNVTQAMIEKWNNKWDSAYGKDISRAKTDGYNTSNVWQSISSTRDLEDWIGDFDKRTRELKDNLDKKPEVVEMSLTDYNNLTTKKSNIIYAVY
ncbi:hypothetical protein ACQRC6_01015 [Peptoniphilus sp. SGI.035]|uniref:hypothetical protein n=1 Tax=Peptoniphilus sp. SGI.035 TaxID=3420564 RepID=UPI003D0939C6